MELQRPSISPSNLGLINNRGGAYCELSLYLAYHACIPNEIIENKVNCRLFKTWFEKAYNGSIQKKICISRDLHSGNGTEEDDIYYFIEGELLLYLDTNHNRARILFPSLNEGAKKLQSEIQLYQNLKPEKATIHILQKGYNAFNLEPLEINKLDLNIHSHYNDDFLPVHQRIMKRLSTADDKGIVLLHGKPGTGKTSYIRYLVSKLEKQVIFLPPSMAAALTDPGMISILIENPNSIFVIEDAENILMAREANGKSPVSTLLNISDGLLADCLNIQIICTFNTDLSKVDKALTRKGRMIARYDFQALSPDKANALSMNLGKSKSIAEPRSLAEIYHQEDPSFSEPKQAIGF